MLKSLEKKGFVKLQTFQKSEDKIKRLQYIITPKGISERTKLTINFMKRKMKEYDELKKELEEKIKMWIVVKFDKKNLNLLKQDLSNKLGKDIKFYIPKILIKKFYKNKLLNKEFYLLGDYMFCYHRNLADMTFSQIIKNCKGMKYILNDVWNFKMKF